MPIEEALLISQFIVESATSGKQIAFALDRKGFLNPITPGSPNYGYFSAKESKKIALNHPIINHVGESLCIKAKDDAETPGQMRLKMEYCTLEKADPALSLLPDDYFYVDDITVRLGGQKVRAHLETTMMNEYVFSESNSSYSITIPPKYDYASIENVQIYHPSESDDGNVMIIQEPSRHFGKLITNNKRWNGVYAPIGATQTPSSLLLVSPTDFYKSCYGGGQYGGYFSEYSSQLMFHSYTFPHTRLIPGGTPITLRGVNNETNSTTNLNLVALIEFAFYRII
jgi:hypothetical protein